MRGPHLYVLQRLGIFRNRLSREGIGQVKEWLMTDRMKAEIDARLAYCGLACSASPLKIGLYVDDGCRGVGVARWAELLDGSPDAELKLLSGEDLRNGGLAGLDLFVSPGGAGGPQTAAMGEKGRAAIRAYVAVGGKYLGICCGFANVLNEQPGFAVRNTMMPFRRMKGGPRGGVTASVRFTPEGTNALGLCESDFHIRYHNGPIVEATEPVPPCSNVVVLATMNCELNEFGAVETPMFGTPACVSADYGKGRMLVYNCHPETNADTRHLVASSIRFLTGRDFRLPASRTAKGCERVGFVTKNMPKATVMRYLELLHKPNISVIPLTEEDLRHGTGEICDRIVTP